MDQWKDGQNARRDAELVYYMQTHPEDFPEKGTVGLFFSAVHY